MKSIFIFILLSVCLFTSCNRKNEKKITISSNFDDYPANVSSAVEEVKRKSLNHVEFDVRTQKFIIDTAWTLPKPIIDEMRANEYIVLSYRSQGCFGGEEKKIILKKLGSKIFCILSGQLIMELTEHQINDFRKLESFCTTVSTYYFYLGNRLRTYTDNTCDNDGLLHSLTNNILVLGIPVKN
jgi:hypothetical protein